MKVTKVAYSRLVSKGNYENAKIEIEAEVEQGDLARDVYEKIKEWVDKRVEIEKMSDAAIMRARRVMEDKRHHTLAQIEEAEELLKKCGPDDSLPF